MPAHALAEEVVSRGVSKPRPLASLAVEFIDTKRAAGCSERTYGVYQWWLDRLLTKVGDHVASLDATAVTQFLAELRQRGLSPSTVHQAYRTLRTFTAWLVRAGALAQDPMAGLQVKTPVMLPQVHTADELRAVLGCCPETFPGRRNRAAILVMADSGVRSEELRRLRIEHLNLQTGSIFVRGKGAKDRVVFISAPTLKAIRDYLAMRPGATGSGFLFADAQDRPLKARHLVQVLHRLSGRAGLEPNRRLHPHALRHWAATSWMELPRFRGG